MHAIIVVASAFIFIALSVFVVTSGEYLSAKNALSWKSVECKVTDSGVNFRASRAGGAYYAEVKYDYSVHGRNYRGDRPGYLFEDAFEHSEAGRIEAQRVASGLALRKRAFYNPNDPSESVLSIGHDFATEFRRIVNRAFVACVGGFFLFAGLLCFLTFNDQNDDRPPYAREADYAVKSKQSN